jgi:hypothetical protein
LIKLHALYKTQWIITTYRKTHLELGEVLSLFINEGLSRNAFLSVKRVGVIHIPLLKVSIKTVDMPHAYFIMSRTSMSRDSSVGIATGYGLGD